MANDVIAGDYEGAKITTTMFGKAVLVSGFRRIPLNKKTVESYELVDSETKTSAGSAITRGAVGGFLLGPIGIAASLSAKKKGTYLLAIVFKDGKQSLIDVNKKVYQAILKHTF